MSIGTGIAIAGVWLFPVACALAPKVTGVGFILAILVAAVATAFLGDRA